MEEQTIGFLVLVKCKSITQFSVCWSIIIADRWLQREKKRVIHINF